LLLLVLSSCSKPKGFEYKGLNHVTIKNVGFEYVDVSLNLVCYNPNNFRLDLKQVDCEVYIDNRFLGKYTLDTLLHIPKKQNFELPSQMRVSMGGVFKNAFSVFMNKEVLIKVKGKTKIGKGFIFLDVPFTYETRQAISL
jgi:LEA14-like dessication related protein